MRVEKQKVNSRRPAIHGNRQLLTNWLLVDIKPSHHTLQSRRHSTSHSHFDHGGGDVSDMALGSGLSVGVEVALLRSAPVQGVSRPPHTASRDCRNGSPLARAIPCAPAPECGVTWEKGSKRAKGWQNDAPKEQEATRISACVPTRSAASRAGMAGWAGEGGGRFGERREYEAPTLPSTPRQHDSARHYKRQSRNGTPPHTSAKNSQRQPQNSCLVKMRMADTPHPFQVWARAHSRCGFKLKNCSVKNSKKCELLVHI